MIKYKNHRTGKQYQKLIDEDDLKPNNTEEFWKKDQMNKQMKMLKKVGVNPKKLTKDSRVFKVFENVDCFTDYLEDAILKKEYRTLKYELSHNSTLTFVVYAALRIKDDLKEKQKRENGNNDNKKNGNNDNKKNGNNDNQKKTVKKIKTPNKSQQVVLIMHKIQNLREKYEKKQENGLNDI